MATDLDGIFNIGLNGLRDRKVFDKWLVELKKLNIDHATYTDHKTGKKHVEEGDWEYEISGFGGDDPHNDEIDFPYNVCFYGPFMYRIQIMDNIATFYTFYRLHILFEQPAFFNDFIKEVHKILYVFNATEVTWLSSLGSASYSRIYQTEVWENIPYEKVKLSLIRDFGQPISYEDAVIYNEEVSWSYEKLDCFVVDHFGAD